MEDPDGVRIVLVEVPRRPSPAPRPALSRRPADSAPADPAGAGPTVEENHAQARRADRGARLPAARRWAPAPPARTGHARPTGSRSPRAPCPPTPHRPRLSGPGGGGGDRAGGAGPARPGRPAVRRRASASTTSAPARTLAASGVGGIFLAGRSHAPAADLAATVARWQAAAPGPRPLGRRRPGGRRRSSPCRGPGSTRCPRRSPRAPCPPAELAALADRLGAALRGAGVNLDLAPVADVVPAGHRVGQSADRRLRPPVRQHRRRGRRGGGNGGRRPRRARGDRDAQALPRPGPGAAEHRHRAHVADATTTADDDQVAAFGRAGCAHPREPFVMMSSAVYTTIDPADAGRLLPGRRHRPAARAAAASTAW